MQQIYSEFKRVFSLSMCKNLKIKLGEMSFYKDFVNGMHGDLYPITQKSDDLSESVQKNCYMVERGSIRRLFCRFFPFASYEMTASLSGGEAGFSFSLPGCEALIFVSDKKIVYSSGEVGKNGRPAGFCRT